MKRDMLMIIECRMLKQCHDYPYELDEINECVDP